MEGGVVLRTDLGPQTEMGPAVTARNVDARTDRCDVFRAAAPNVDRVDFAQLRGVAVDEVVLLLHLFVGCAHFVVRGFDELFAEAELELRIVEIAPRGEGGRVEGPQEVRNFVFHDVASVAEVVAVEVGLDAQFVARAEDVGVVHREHGAALAVESGVGTDGPAVAGVDHDVDDRRVQRIGHYFQFGVGDVGARAEQLFVAHQNLRVYLVARTEQEVAADHAVAREHVDVVARAFEPVAVGREDLFACNGDFADGLACIGLEEAVFVEHAPVVRRVEYGADEKHLVEQARHGPAARFGGDAVVETPVALGPLEDGRVRRVASGPAECGYAFERVEPDARNGDAKRIGM